MSREDVTRARFEETAARLAALADRRIDGLRERLREFVPLTGEERVLDSGTGAGTIALALAPLVRSVVGVDFVPAMIDQARRRAEAYPNLELIVGDALALPFPDGSFDLAASGRTLHHLDRPEQAVRELARVIRPGGHVLVIDQVAPGDPGSAALLEEIEALRDPAHARTLAGGELHLLLEGAGLEVERVEVDLEDRDLGEFLDLAGCQGAARAAAFAAAEREAGSASGRGLGLRRQGSGVRFAIRVGWYRARKPG